MLNKQLQQPTMVITGILLLRAAERWQHGVLKFTPYIATEIRITPSSSRQIAAKWETTLARYHAANIGTAALTDLKVEFCHCLQLQNHKRPFSDKPVITNVTQCRPYN
jgi:hypothetical protein